MKRIQTHRRVIAARATVNGIKSTRTRPTSWRSGSQPDPGALGGTPHRQLQPPTGGIGESTPTPTGGRSGLVPPRSSHRAAYGAPSDHADASLSEMRLIAKENARRRLGGSGNV